MKYIFFLFLSLTVFFGNCQDNTNSRIYLDHNGNIITQEEASNLVRNRLILGLTYTKGIDTISKATLIHQFGKLSINEYSEIKSSISQKSSTNIRDDDYIIIRYKDTLHNYESYIKHIKNNLNYNLKLSKYNFNQDRRNEQLKIKKATFERLQIKDFKKWKKYKNKIEKKYRAKVFYVSNINNLENNLEWVLDNGIIKQKFLKHDVRDRTIVIKSDGSYFISIAFTEKIEKELLKNNDWSSLENDLFEILKNNSLYENNDVFYLYRYIKTF